MRSREATPREEPLASMYMPAMFGFVLAVFIALMMLSRPSVFCWFPNKTLMKSSWLRSVTIPKSNFMIVFGFAVYSVSVETAIPVNAAMDNKVNNIPAIITPNTQANVVVKNFFIVPCFYLLFVSFYFYKDRFFVNKKDCNWFIFHS